MKYFNKLKIGSSGKFSNNCLALAPMTTMQSNSNGTVSNEEYEWLVRRAKGKFGILISCAAYISKDGKMWENQMGVHSDECIPGLKRLANGIHNFGSIALIQLFHGGARSSEEHTGEQPFGPSAQIIGSDPPKLIREASLIDIDRVIKNFVLAAVRVHKAGWDGIELHAAHGYLLHQFLSTETNQRKDEWGGNIENRTRILFSIIKEIRKAVPSDFIIGVRLSPEDRPHFKGIDFDDGLVIAEDLATPDIDYIHLSAWEATKRPDKYKEKKKTMIEYYREMIPSNVMLMVAGEIWTKEQADNVIELGADCVAIGRAAIANPDWPILSTKIVFKPIRPAYSPKFLKSKSVSENFVKYLKNWKGFVVSSVSKKVISE